MNTPVFEVMEVQSLNNHRWLVRGRAWEDVRIGDIVEVSSSEVSDQNHSSTFTVISISTYGHDMEELNRMFTGTLVLQGLDKYVRAGQLLFKSSS